MIFYFNLVGIPMQIIWSVLLFYLIVMFDIFLLLSWYEYRKCIDNSVSDSLSGEGSENSDGDSEYYEENDDYRNTAGAEMEHWTSYNPRTRRQSFHLVLPSTFQHYGSFYLRMGAVGGLNIISISMRRVNIILSIIPAKIIIYWSQCHVD